VTLFAGHLVTQGRVCSATTAPEKAGLGRVHAP
jgi:hypothetical protein